MNPILPIRFISRKIITKQNSVFKSHEYGELYYSYQGIMELMVNGSYYIAPQQYCLWLPPYTQHCCLCQKEVIFFALHIDPVWVHKLSQRVCVVTISPLLQYILEYLYLQPQTQLTIPENQHLLQVAYDQLLQASFKDNYLPYSNDPLIAPILTLFTDNPADENTITNLAKRVNSTERTIMRRAKQELGMSLTEWKLRFRVIKAMEMLNNGLSVERIALELGYSNASAFIHMFRKLTNMTPREFRNQV